LIATKIVWTASSEVRKTRRDRESIVHGLRRVIEEEDCFLDISGDHLAGVEMLEAVNILL
jgi:hypothetical protein